ncbi:MAG: LamG domain-containing protein, partial [Verrucomicrobiales bacterium]|nr:LamG domain-containing protein [Verrucomicrobiales bacterium]
MKWSNRSNALARAFSLVWMLLGLGFAEVRGAPAPIPAHWWSGDGAANDRAGNAPGTLQGGVDYAAGRFGKAFRFDGTGAVSFGPDVGNFGTNDFSVTLWVNVGSGTEILSKRTLCGVTVLWDIRYVAGELWAEYLVSALPVRVQVPMSTGEWHHVAVTRTGPLLALYLDGALVSQKVDNQWTAAGGIRNTAPLLLGDGPCGSPLQGSVDEVILYDRALTATEVSAQANSEGSSIIERAILGTRKAKVDFGLGRSQFTWIIEPAEGQSFDATSVAGVELESTADLTSWATVPGGVRLSPAGVEAADTASRANGARFYRLAFRNPRVPPPSGGAVSTSKIPANVLATAREHVEAFIEGETGATPEDAGWVGVQFAPEARYVYDPGHQGALQPAFVELKLISDRGAPRGYVLVSTTGARPSVVEFSQEGATKTERAQKANGGRLPHRFVRFNGSFLALENAAGDLVGRWGTWPALPTGTPSTEAPTILEGSYDSETETLSPLARQASALVPTGAYGALRSGFALNGVRGSLARLRTAVNASRGQVLAGDRNRLAVPVGETRDFATGETFVSARVDVDGDDDLPGVRVSLLPRGFRVLGLRAGSDLIRARTRSGSVVTYSVTTSPAGRSALAGTGNCRRVVVHRYLAGTGWDGDQRRYHQPGGELWCPAVGCGPAALAMFYGWWDVHGVPSAFYRVRTGFGEPIAFRFEYESLREGNAGQVVSDGETIQGPGGVELYKLSLEEAVMHDFHGLCNTFCVDGQGATMPWDMTGGAVDYVLRVARNLGAPRNE